MDEIALGYTFVLCMLAGQKPSKTDNTVAASLLGMTHARSVLEIPDRHVL